MLLSRCLGGGSEPSKTVSLYFRQNGAGMQRRTWASEPAGKTFDSIAADDRDMSCACLGQRVEFCALSERIERSLVQPAFFDESSFGQSLTASRRSVSIYPMSAEGYAAL